MNRRKTQVMNLVEFATAYGSGPDIVEYARHLAATIPDGRETDDISMLGSYGNTLIVDLLLHEPSIEHVRGMVRGYMRSICWSTTFLTELLCEVVARVHERAES